MESEESFETTIDWNKEIEKDPEFHAKIDKLTNDFIYNLKYSIFSGYDSDLQGHLAKYRYEMHDIIAPLLVKSQTTLRDAIFKQKAKSPW